jgi:hypothetical protein
MSLQEKRLDVAVKLSRRALRGAPEASIEQRLESFKAAWAVVTALDAGDEEWSAETLDAAWNLVVDAWPKGGAPEALTAALAEAHRVVVEAAGRAPRRGMQPRRNRKEA